MGNVAKERRELLTRPSKNDEIVLNDLIQQLADLTGDLSTIEMSVNVNACSRVVAGLIEHEKKVAEFKKKIRDIKEEFVRYNHSRPNRHKGNKKSLPNN